MKNLLNLLQEIFKSNRSAEFYYIQEEISYEESVEMNKLRYLTSFDRAA